MLLNSRLRHSDSSDSDSDTDGNDLLSRRKLPCLRKDWDAEEGELSDGPVPDASGRSNETMMQEDKPPKSNETGAAMDVSELKKKKKTNNIWSNLLLNQELTESFDRIAGVEEKLTEDSYVEHLAEFKAAAREFEKSQPGGPSHSHAGSKPDSNAHSLLHDLDRDLDDYKKKHSTTAEESESTMEAAAADDEDVALVEDDMDTFKPSCYNPAISERKFVPSSTKRPTGNFNTDRPSTSTTSAGSSSRLGFRDGHLNSRPSRSVRRKRQRGGEIVGRRPNTTPPNSPVGSPNRRSGNGGVDQDIMDVTYAPLNDPDLLGDADKMGPWIARQLKEQKPRLIIALVAALGPNTSSELYTKTIDVETTGGMMTITGFRRRTPGGVFIQLARDQTDQGPETVAAVEAVLAAERTEYLKMVKEQKRNRKARLAQVAANQAKKMAEAGASAAGILTDKKENDVIDSAKPIVIEPQPQKIDPPNTGSPISIENQCRSDLICVENKPDATVDIIVENGDVADAEIIDLETNEEEEDEFARELKAVQKQVTRAKQLRREHKPVSVKSRLGFSHAIHNSAASAANGRRDAYVVNDDDGLDEPEPVEETLIDPDVPISNGMDMDRGEDNLLGEEPDIELDYTE